MSLEWIAERRAVLSTAPESCRYCPSRQLSAQCATRVWRRAVGLWGSPQLSNPRSLAPGVPWRVFQYPEPRELWQSHQRSHQPLLRPIDANAGEQPGFRRRKRRLQPSLPDRRPALHPAGAEASILIKLTKEKAHITRLA